LKHFLFFLRKVVFEIQIKRRDLLFLEKPLPPDIKASLIGVRWLTKNYLLHHSEISYCHLA